MIEGNFNFTLAISLIRIITGILFFFQGYDKLFNVKVTNIVQTFKEPLYRYPIFRTTLRPLVTISSIIELICGILLFIGLFRNVALILLSMDLIVVAFTFSIIKPMWDMSYFFPRMIFVVLLLFCIPGPDFFCLDYLLGIGYR
jgi:uncharacterized membrane protein YphA (DoxX/SURF4 family)